MREPEAVKGLLVFSRAIDTLNEWVGRIVAWLVLVAVLVSSGNAVMRYGLNWSSNAWLELQWYLFSAVFLLCAGYTLLRNEHIRIDIVTGNLSRRAQAWIDVIGGIFFLLPVTLLILWLSWPMFVESYIRDEVSADPGGLLRWPVKILVPIGFLLLALQGISELIKRIAYLRGVIPHPAQDPTNAPLQHSAESNA